MRQPGDRLVICDGGGAFNRVFTETLYRPFEAKSGVRVEGVTSASEPTEQIEEMVRAGRPAWDLSLLSNQSQATLAARDCLEPLGPLGPNQEQIPEDLRDPFMSGLLIYASVLAFRSDRGDEPVPVSWRDFWDVERFPGRRAMRRHPFDTFEQALLADGVTPEMLYPLDLERALRSLDRIRDHVDVWWSSGGESTTLLQGGRVDLAGMWSGRAHAAAAAGAPVSWNWDQGLWTYEGFAILKGTPKADICREFIEFCASARRQADCASKLHYGPASPGAFEHIPPEYAKMLPANPDYFRRMIRIDVGSWAACKDEAANKFAQWLDSASMSS